VLPDYCNNRRRNISVASSTAPNTGSNTGPSIGSKGRRSYKSFELESRFSLLHPGVLMTFFVSTIVLTLLSYHPALLGLSFVLAAASLLRYIGIKTLLQILSWLIPMAGIVVLFNLLFNRRGATELLTIQPTIFGQQQHLTFTLESLLFGLSIALMFAAIILWLRLYQEFMTSDRLLFLLAPFVPTIALSLSMVQRWIPLTKYRWQQIADAQAALNGKGNSISTATKTTTRARYRSFAKSMSALMSWSMEDAIVAADSMQARGYSSAPSASKRTSFRSYRFTVCDTVSLIFIVATALFAGIGIFASTRELAFFPIVRGIEAISPFALVAMAAVMLFPLALSALFTGKEQLRCMTYTSAQKT